MVFDKYKITFILLRARLGGQHVKHFLLLSINATVHLQGKVLADCSPLWDGVAAVFRGYSFIIQNLQDFDRAMASLK